MRPTSTLAVTIAALVVFSRVGLGEAAEIKVTLLGTGTPTPRLSAFSASTLVEAGPERLIFDLGQGSTIRLFQ
jgi:ribonuclease Z